jgi:hypothetical protein
MSDQMKKVQSGDPLSIPAQAYNAFIDAARDFRGRQQNQQRDTHVGVGRSSGIVLIKNESGGNRQRFDVLGLDEPIIDPDDNIDEFKNAVTFRGSVPDETKHRGRFAVLLEPLATGAIGRAVVAGVTIVRLRLDDGSQQVETAEIIDGDEAAMQPASDGSATVLWHQPQSGDVWAVVRLANAAPAGVWVEITSTPSSGSIYSSWREVELTIDGQGQPQWSAKPNGLAGPGDGDLYEVNGVEGITEGTVVQAFPNPAHDPNATNPGPAWLFQYEQPAVIGYGVPADGETDVPHDADIDLTVTDANGNPILDDQGQTQTIKVWRNALKRPLYTDFDSGTVFVYVRFPQPAPSGHGGCIFSRTEAFKAYRDWLPEDGYSLYPGENPPYSTDATGDPGNDEHFHVIGKMFMQADGEGKGWTPWFAIDPEKFGGFKVKTDAPDDTPGYLDDEIQVGENPGQPHTWLRKRVNNEPGAGAEGNDHKLRLYHGDWNAANTLTVGNPASFEAGGNHTAILGPSDNPEPGSAWFAIAEWEDEYDPVKHSRLRLKPGGQKKLVITGLFKVKAHADDPDPDFLDAKLIGDEKWIQTVIDGNQIKIEHIGPDEQYTEIDPIADLELIDDSGTPTLRIHTRKLGHDERGHHTGEAEETEQHDIAIPDEKVKSWEEDPSAGYLLDKIEGDGFWIIKSLENNRIVLTHNSPQEEHPNYTVHFEGDPHIEVMEGSAGFGEPKIPVDANGHITSNLGIQVTHRNPSEEYWTHDPLASLSVSGSNLRVTTRPASVDAKGHMREGGVSEQHHDLALVPVTVVTAFRVEGTDVQVKTRTIYVPKADAESDWTTIHTGTTCPSSGGS